MASLSTNEKFAKVFAALSHAQRNEAAHGSSSIWCYIVVEEGRKLAALRAKYPDAWDGYCMAYGDWRPRL